jgi:hypothetical protein
MRFWANVGIFGGFMLFSFPITVRPQIRYRFLKGMFAGTLGIFAVGPVIPPTISPRDIPPSFS